MERPLWAISANASYAPRSRLHGAHAARWANSAADGCSSMRAASRSGDRCDIFSIPCGTSFRYVYEMREQLPQLRACLEQLGLRSARCDAELLGDLLVRVALDVVEHEHRSRPG